MIAQTIKFLRNLWFVWAGLACVFAGHTWNQLGESSQTNIKQFAAWTVGIACLIIATIVLLWLFFLTWELIAFYYRPSRFQLRLLAGVRHGYFDIWYVTFAGKRIAKLSSLDIVPNDTMQFRVMFLTRDPDRLRQCHDQEFWDANWDKFEFQNFVTNERISSVYGQLVPESLKFSETGSHSLLLHGLFSRYRVEELSWRERVLLTIRERKHGHRRFPVDGAALLILTILAFICFAACACFFGQQSDIPELRQFATVHEWADDWGTEVRIPPDGETTSLFHDSRASLAPLPRVENLGCLIIDNAHLSESNIRHIARCGTLHKLALGGCDIDDVSLEILVENLPSLRMLILSETLITDEGLSTLPSLASLDLLVVSQTAVTDAGCVYLSECTTLNSLHITGTEVTDACLQHLADLPNLQFLHLTHTEVTQEGISWFAGERPDVDVSW